MAQTQTPQQYSVSELATTIRSKYGNRPEHTSMSDQALVDAYIKKYPVNAKYLKPPEVVEPQTLTGIVKPRSMASKAWELLNTSLIDKGLGIDHEWYDKTADENMNLVTPIQPGKGGKAVEASRIDVAKRFIQAAAPATLETFSSFSSPLNLILGAVYGKAARSIKNLKDIHLEKLTQEELFVKATTAKNLKAAKDAKEKLDALRLVEGELQVIEKTNRAIGTGAGVGFAAEGAINSADAIQRYKSAKNAEEEHNAFMDLLQGMATSAGGFAGIESMRVMKPGTATVRRGPAEVVDGPTTTAGPVKTTGDTPKTGFSAEAERRWADPEYPKKGKDYVSEYKVVDLTKTSTMLGNKNKGERWGIIEISKYGNGNESQGMTDSYFSSRKAAEESLRLRKMLDEQTNPIIESTVGELPTTSGAVTTSAPVVTGPPPPIKIKRYSIGGTNLETGKGDPIIIPGLGREIKEKMPGRDFPISPTQKLGPLDELPPKLSISEQRVDEKGFFNLGGGVDEPLLSDLKFDKSSRKWWNPEGRTAKDVKNNFIENFVDDLNPLWQMEQAATKRSPLGINDSPYYSFRRARSHTAKAKSFLHFGPESPLTLKPIGPSLQTILDLVPDKELFSKYLKARYNNKQAAAGLPTTLPLSESKAFANKYEPQFKTALDQLNQYRDGVIQYAAESGALGPNQIDAINRAFDSHVALDRILDFDTTTPNIKGQNLKVQDPLETIIKNTFTIVDVIENNNARTKLGNMLDSNPSALRDWITPISESKIKPVAKVTIKELKKFLDDNGIDVSSLSKEQLESVYTVFRPSTLVGKNAFSYLKEGKRVTYEIKNDALAEAIHHYGTSPDLIGNLLLGAPARAIRTSATLALSFTTRNVLRDTFTAAIQSKYGFTPFVDSLRGLGHMLKRDELYREFLSSGGAQSSLVSVDKNVLRGQLQLLLKGKLHTTTAHPLDILKAIAESMENATRVGAFATAVKGEMRKGTPIHETMARAAMEARDITVDFMRGGSKAREWNKYTAFFNAMIQGNVRAVEVFKARPIEATTRAVMYATIPTILLYGLNRNNEVWRSKEQYDKDANMYIPLNGWDSWTPEGGNVAADEFVAIPKPHGILTDVFSKPYEAFLDFATEKDPEAVTDMFRTMGDTVVSNAIGKSIPSAVLPMIEVASNYSFFRRRNLFSPYDLEVNPALRYNKWTSQTAKDIGGMFNVAPVVVDYLMFAYTTSLGREASRIADSIGPSISDALTGSHTVLPPRPDTALSSLPFGMGEQTPLVGTLLRGGVDLQSGTLSDFYKSMNDLNGVKRSMSLAVTTRNKEMYKKVMEENIDILRAESGMRASQKAMQTQLDRVDRIFEDTVMTPQRKQEELAGIYRRINNLAGRALKREAIPPTSFERERSGYMRQFQERTNPIPPPPPPG